MKIEVTKVVKGNIGTWYYVKTNGLTQIATQDENEALNAARRFEANYKEFGSINPEITIYSVEL